MKNYHKIVLSGLLKHINLSSISNKLLTSIDEINIYLNEEYMSSSECIAPMQSILFEVINPQIMHDGSVKLAINNNKIFIISGNEKIISALYHQETHIIIYSEDDITSYFEDIHSYQSLSQIDFSFSQFPLSEEICNTSINYNSVFDMHYAEIIMNKDNLDYADKETIIREIKCDNYDVLKKMPEELLADDDFMIELLHVQSDIINECFALDDPRQFTIAEKLYNKNDEASNKLLAYILANFWQEFIHYFYEYIGGDKYEITPNENVQEFINTNFFSNMKLVHFILTNNYFVSYYKYKLEDIVPLIPKGSVKDQLKEEIISKLSINNFYLIPAAAFNDNNCLAKIFSKVITNYHYDETLSVFSKKYEYTYSYWADNKENLLDILSKTSSRPVVYTEPFMSIYNLISPSLKKDKEIVLALVKIFPDTVKVLPKKLRYDTDIIKMYVNHINELSFKCFHEYEIEKLFIVDDEKSIKKICFNKPEVLLHPDVPSSWKENIELYHLDMEFTAINFKKYPQYIQDNIINNEETFNKYMDKHPILYESLPLNMQLNKEYALKYANKYDELKLPQSLLINKDFCIQMVLQQPTCIKLIPDKIKNNTHFILTVFKSIYASGLYESFILNIFKESYKDIFKLLDFFNVPYQNTCDFLLEHFKNQENYKLYQDMQNQLPTANIKNNKRKI